MGYTGGTTADPTYQAIGDHTEALRITYDPQEIDEESLVRRSNSPPPATSTLPPLLENHVEPPSYF